MRGSKIRASVKRALAGPKARRHALVGPAELWKMKRSFQVTFLRSRGLEPHHRLVDIGCGTLRGGIPLIEYLEPGGYVGIDAREVAIAEAGKELREAGLADKAPSLIASPTLSSVQLEHPADIFWAFSVLIHLDDEKLEDCFDFVRSSAAPDAVFYANVRLGSKLRTGTWEGFPVMIRPFEDYASLGERYGFVAEDLGALGELGHHSGEAVDHRHHMLTFRSPRELED